MTRQEYVQNEYRKNRYMKDLDDDTFMCRFNDVLQNLLIIDDNGKISIPSLKKNSTIFWVNHWMHVLAEEEIRFTGLTNLDRIFLAKTRDFLYTINLDKLKTIRYKIEKNVWLYKFSKRKYLEQIVSTGKIIIKPASYYSDSSLNKAIKDNELMREYYVKNDLPNVSVEIDKRYETHKIINDKYNKTMNTDYYVYCLDQLFDPRMFCDFDADACLIIKQPKLFLRKLYDNLFREDKYKCYSGKIKYYDPLLDNPLKGLIPFTKYFGYTYQNEYRAVFLPEKNIDKLPWREIFLGNISDYVEIVDVIK